MMKRLFSILFATLFSVAVMAVPAMRFTRQVQQPDGTTLTIKLVGDELFSYYATVDGVPVKQQQDGSYVYARCEAGHFIPTTTLAHDLALRSVGEQAVASSILATPITRSAEAEKIAEANTARRARRASSGPNHIGTSGNFKGEKRGIIILVEYPDRQMVYTREDFDEQMNANNYNKNGHIGSLADYFYDQSYGQLSIDFDVVGPYMLPHEMAYYGAHKGESNDSHAGQMVVDAIHLADDDVDFSNYDWTGNRQVDQVFVVFAGYAEAQGGAPETIWPHEWNLYSAYYSGSSSEGSIYTDGVWIDTYACSSELAFAAGTNLAGIGTAAHEFSHCLGIPDFYDARYSGGIGMTDWSVMDNGSYKKNGNIPAAYTSYERWFCGWLEPTVLDEPCWVKGMKHLVASPEAYVIYNQKTKNEYYMLENHQATGDTGDYRNWDTGIPGHGMLVLHVDYNSQKWSSNNVNTDASHQRMTFIPADGRMAATSGTLYPGTRRNSALTNTSTPAAKLFNKNTDGSNFMNRPIENISETGGLITFKFYGGTRITVPEMTDPTDVSAAGFTAHWSEVENATSYTLQLKEKESNDQQTLFEQDFTTNPALTAEGKFDAAADVNTFMGEEGWTAKRIYTAVNRLCISSSTQTGYLRSPLYEAPYDGIVTVNVGYQRYKTNTSTLKVQILDEEGGILSEAIIDPTIKDGVEKLSFTDINQNFSINLTTSGKQVYLTSLSAQIAVTPMQVEGLTQASHTFEGLTPGTVYSIRVRAHVGQDFSFWSEYADVELLGETAISAPTSNETQKGVWYNLSGQRVASPQRGVYIRNNQKVLLP